MKQILQTIFSIKNTQRHKVLCILGLKFKFKRKKIKDKIDTTQLVILNTIKCFGEISEFLNNNKAFFFLFGRGLRLNQEKIKLRNQVNLKTASGEYKTEYNPCLCGAHNDEIIANRDRYDIRVNTVICKHCGLIRTSPYYTEDTLNNFYNTEYRSLYTFVNNDYNTFFEGEVNSGRVILKVLEEHINFLPKNKIVYEIVTGMVGILKPFKDKGAKITGVDLGEEYINIGKERGLNLEVGSVDKLKKYEKADLLILNHIAEHIVDIVSFLKECRNVIKNDGTLYIAVPTIETIPINYGNNIFNYLQNAHVYNFSEETLKYVIERAGFKSIDYVTELGCIIAKKTNKFREQNDVDESHYKYALDLLKRFDRDYFMGL